MLFTPARRICAAVFLLLFALPALAQPFGVDTRVANTTLLIDAKPGETGDHPVPDKLSDEPALLAAASRVDQTAEGIYPYAPASPLWSDGAVKSRYIALPGMAQITYTESGGWNLPDGTALIKNFYLPLDFRDPENTAFPLETRLIVKLNGTYNYYSYEWNDDGTDANLLPSSDQHQYQLTGADGNPLIFTWRFPNRTDCTLCHSAAANFVLGPSTPQMNSLFKYPASGVTANQMATFEHIGLFDAPLPDSVDNLPASPNPYDPNAGTLEQRALSYVNTNCAMCHQPGGTSFVSIDFRWGLPLSQRHLINVTPTLSNLGVQGALRIKPGDPGSSVVFLRMDRRGTNQMPPLATTLIDEKAVQLMSDWISSLPAEGEGEGGAGGPYAADEDQDGMLSLSEVLRVVQFYNAGGLHCASASEDGYAPGAGGDLSCSPYSSDYNPQDWQISLSELLRVIQLYAGGAFHYCGASGEDGYCFDGV